MTAAINGTCGLRARAEGEISSSENRSMVV